MTIPWSEFSPAALAALAILSSLAAHLLFKGIVLRALTKLAGATENDLDDRLIMFARRFSGGVFFFLAVIGSLKAYGIEVTPLLAGAGIGGIALGLAAKDTLGDILSGVFLIADRPIRVGDRIKVEPIGRDWGGWGDVLDIGLRRTQIRNTDGVIVNYPNSLLSNSVITNFSIDKEPLRVRIRFQVDYDADLKLVLQVAEDAIEGKPGIIPGTADVVVRSLWDVTRGHLLSGILIEARYRIEATSDRTRIRSRLIQDLLLAFKEADIQLALPRVHSDRAS